MERNEIEDWDFELFDNLPKMSTRSLPCPACDEEQSIAADAPRASEGEVVRGMAQMPDGDHEDDDVSSRLA
jgi:hypothetical protein